MFIIINTKTASLETPDPYLLLYNNIGPAYLDDFCRLLAIFIVERRL